jgi:flagellar biosynthesis/type III secretory pathway chaperone
VDQNVCREHLEKLISEESTALARLEGLLDKEHAVLQSNDIDELDRTGEARQACIGELVRIEDERRSLCRMLNVSADPQGLDRLLGWCDPSNKLKRRWASCAERATRCRDLNDRNGALVAARLKRVEGMLDVVTGRTNQPKVYGKHGAVQTSPRSVNVIATV